MSGFKEHGQQNLWYLNLKFGLELHVLHVAENIVHEPLCFWCGWHFLLPFLSCGFASSLIKTPWNWLKEKHVYLTLASLTIVLSGVCFTAYVSLKLYSTTYMYCLLTSKKNTTFNLNQVVVCLVLKTWVEHCFRRQSFR